MRSVLAQTLANPAQRLSAPVILRCSRSSSCHPRGLLGSLLIQGGPALIRYSQGVALLSEGSRGRGVLVGRYLIPWRPPVPRRFDDSCRFTCLKGKPLPLGLLWGPTSFDLLLPLIRWGRCHLRPVGELVGSSRTRPGCGRSSTMGLAAFIGSAGWRHIRGSLWHPWQHFRIAGLTSANSLRSADLVWKSLLSEAFPPGSVSSTVGATMKPAMGTRAAVFRW